MDKPLSGIRIIELAGIGPGPFAGQIFADMGADVICVERPGGGLIAGKAVERRNKKSIVVDLRQPEGAALVLKLVETADILFEGNRPGVAERLGLGPADCHNVNPKLVYGRMTGWGQNGPWAGKAGHDINYLSITGALYAMGSPGMPPPVPLNFIGDYGGGTMPLVFGCLAALLRAQKTGQGEIVDAAIIDGVSAMMGMVYSLDSLGFWRAQRGGNLLDGAMPFYRCYSCACGGFVAAGCIEPQFFALMLDALGINAGEFGGQMDPKAWPAQHQKLEKIFASKTRDEWAEIFDGSDACVTPVLNYEEAKSHPQNQARQGLKSVDGLTHPRPIPVFGEVSAPKPPLMPARGADSRKILSEIGLEASAIDALIAAKIVSA